MGNALKFFKYNLYFYRNTSIVTLERTQENMVIYLSNFYLITDVNAYAGFDFA